MSSEPWLLSMVDNVAVQSFASVTVTEYDPPLKLVKAFGLPG